MTPTSCFLLLTSYFLLPYGNVIILHLILYCLIKTVILVINRSCMHLRGAFVFIYLLSFFLQPARVKASPLYNDTTRSACLQNASRLLDEAFSIMQKNYYKREGVNWDSLYRAAKERLVDADNCDDIYSIIDWCFRQFDEHHSFIMPPSRAAIYNYDTARLSAKPTLHQLVGEIKGEMIDGGIGYITVPWIRTTDPDICTKLADSLQQVIATLDRHGISKWIIDLRSNSGGNCWPMLAGIGPLLGEGICGYF